MLYNMRHEGEGLGGAAPRERWALCVWYSSPLLLFFVLSSPTYLVPIRRVSLRPPGGPQGVMCVLLRISVVWSINIGHLRSNDRVLCCKVHALEVGRN